MNVYAESNFVLEKALEQEQSDSCAKLIDFAGAGDIRLVIPAFSLVEPHITLMHKRSERNRLASELKRHLTELGRSKPYQHVSANFINLASVLIDSAQSEGSRLQAAVDGIRGAAEIIPLTSEVLNEAKGFQFGFDISFQDAVVLASVVQHLKNNRSSESCFLNRNTKDFADPTIRDLLEHFRCRFFGRFDDALAHIKAHLGI